MTHDYIVQIIEQLVAFIARLGGLRDEKRYDEAEEAIGDALRAAFGPLQDTLDEVTPESFVSIVDNEEKRRLCCTMLRERAHIARARHQSGEARRLETRAERIERATAS